MPLQSDGACDITNGSRCGDIACAIKLAKGVILEASESRASHEHSARLYTRNAGDFAGLGDLVDVVTV